MKKNFFIRKNVILIILVRLKSKRLPQKAKLKINKFSLIETLIKRLIRHFPKKQIYICTSNKEKDNYLKNICEIYKVNFHRGDDKDIFKRIITLRKKKYFDHFVRITGDNPFTDLSAIKVLVKNHLIGKFDYTYTNDLPVGTRSEIISYNALKKANNLALDTKSSEYMTYFFKRSIFKILELPFKKFIKKQSLLNLSIDTLDQYLLLKKILRNQNVFISRKKLINLCKTHKKMFHKISVKDISLKNNKYDVRFKKNLSNRILV